MWLENSLDDPPSWFWVFRDYVVYPVVSIGLGLSPILVLMYVVYLVRITRKRIENGTTNLALSLFHLDAHRPVLGLWPVLVICRCIGCVNEPHIL